MPVLKRRCRFFFQRRDRGRTAATRPGYTKCAARARLRGSDRVWNHIRRCGVDRGHDNPQPECQRTTDKGTETALAGRRTVTIGVGNRALTRDFLNFHCVLP